MVIYIGDENDTIIEFNVNIVPIDIVDEMIGTYY